MDLWEKAFVIRHLINYHCCLCTFFRHSIGAYVYVVMLTFFFGNPINAKAMVGIYRIVSGLYKLTIKIIFGQEAFVEFLNEFLRFDLAQAIAAYFLQTLLFCSRQQF